MRKRFQVNFINSSGVEQCCIFNTVEEAMVFYFSIELKNRGQWKKIFRLGECSQDDALLKSARRV